MSAIKSWSDPKRYRHIKKTVSQLANGLPFEIDRTKRNHFRIRIYNHRGDMQTIYSPGTSRNFRLQVMMETDVRRAVSTLRNEEKV